MFGDPVAGEAKAFGMNGKVGGIGQSGGDISAFNNGDEIKQGEFGHLA